MTWRYAVAGKVKGRGNNMTTVREEMARYSRYDEWNLALKGVY